MLLPYILAAISGWAFDDFCGTPPRPWPGPGPWWWLRKVAAMLGALAAYLAYHPNYGDNGSLVSIIIVGGVGGVFLASLVGGLGLGARTVETTRN